MRQVGSGGAAAGEARCVVLKNMFDRLSDEAQSNPNFYTELEADVVGRSGLPPRASRL